MDITERVARIVFSRAGNRCSFPNCNQVIAFKEESGEYANVGMLAHIKGDKPKAPRYDENQSEQERNSADNLILLCGTHHKIIDDQKEFYPVEKLIEMKRKHEELITNLYSKEIVNVTFSELDVITKFLAVNSQTDEDISTTHPKEKINKNHISPKNEGLIRMGLAQNNLIRKFIKLNPDTEFGERLKQGFVEKYNELKEHFNGDYLFDVLLDFATGNTSDFRKKAAGVTVLSYFFEKCDIFEK